MLLIQPMEQTTAALYNQVDNRYLVGEMAAVRVARSGFTLEFAPLNKAEWHFNPLGAPFDSSELVDRKDAVCFFAFLDGQLAGQAVVSRHFHQLAMLWDIRVDVRSRRNGVGRMLIQACRDWAVLLGLKGIMVETRDTNPAACQFFQSCGFILGGVDRMLYAADAEQMQKPPAMRDCALFFYSSFE